MKFVVLACFALVALAYANPVKEPQNDLYLLEEDKRNARSYLLVEKEKGVYTVEDLVNAKIELEASPSDVTLYLYTKTNEEDPVVLTVNDLETLANSKHFKKTRTNVFISHGWNNDVSSAVNALVKSALLDTYDVNVFVVDWHVPANKNYITAKNAVPTIGEAEGDFINGMIEKFGLTPSNFILIGHSLGAHVAGCAGAKINGKVDTIVGLDPASPLYTMGNTDNRLDTSDASFVHVIHTCGGLLGFLQPIGHSDHFPNGGETQPGCGLDLAGTCAHSRSYQYFAESIRKNNFIARECNSIRDYINGSCTNHKKTVMGGYKVDKTVSGHFYLKTNSVEPFGEGESF